MAQTIGVYWVEGASQFTLYRSQFSGGAFGAKELFYDTSVDPPSVPPSGAATPFIQGLSAGQSDANGILVNIRTNDFPITPAITQEFFEDPLGNTVPIVIDNTNHLYAITNNILLQGPFSFNDKLYVFGGTDLKHITVYVSTDSGATWTALDQANSPGVPGKFLCSFCNGVDHKIYTAFIDGSDHLWLCEFDIDTELWGAPHDENSTITFGTATPRPTSVQPLTNGDIFVTYNKGISAFPRSITVFGAVLSSAVWTNDIQISANFYAAQDNFHQTVVCPAGTSYVFWSQTDPGTFHTRLFSRRRDDDGTLGTEERFPDQVNGGVNIGHLEIFDVGSGDEIWFPYKYFPYPAGAAGIHVFRGTPLTPGTDATWTDEPVVDEDLNYDYPFAIISGESVPPPPEPPAITCPIDGASLVVGTPYTTTITPVGGTAPFTFEITAGSLPPGLTLDASTGIISGTPTLAGTYGYTIKVTDANSLTDEVTCEFVVAPADQSDDPERTLRFQIPQKRWFPHVYGDAIATHYLVEPREDAPNTQDLVLLSRAQGLIYLSQGNTDNGVEITSIIQTPSYDGGDQRGQKLYVDAMHDFDNQGTIASFLQFDNNETPGMTEVFTPAGDRALFLQEIASQSDLALYRNISARYTWSGGPDGPRVYAVEPSGYIQPYLSERMVTQIFGLSYAGWKHHRRLYAGVISNANLTFTILCQDGRTYSATIPSTGGGFKIQYVMLPQNIKDLAFSYQLQAVDGSRFALFGDEFTVEVKEWRGPEYIRLAVFKA